MKRLITIAILLSIITLQSQDFEKSLLWKISGKGIEKPSYIFGTIHATCDASLSPKVMNALKNTDQLYLEMDLDNPNMQSEMMSDMMMKDSISMSKLASKEDFEIVDIFLKEQLGYSLQLFNTIKPFFVSAMFYPKILDCKSQSIEAELMKISQQQNKEIFGLETIKEQMALFDVIPYQEQMNELIKSVKSKLVNDKKDLTDGLKMYEKEDLNGLVEICEKSENTMMSKYNDELLINRNRIWIPKIENEIAQKPTFFGVGAAHLAGKNGVIMLLRKNGYIVEAVFDN
jgi:uncharacterized protein YbaP (TraB family)